jgi:GNAT superfamily N-acetyltransferase
MKLFKFLIVLVLFSNIFGVYKGPANDEQLHKWASESNMEFWDAIARSAGYARGRTDTSFWARGSGLLYAQMMKEHPKSDDVLQRFSQHQQVILFLDKKDFERQRKYISKINITDHFTNMGMDLSQLPQQVKQDASIKVWKVKSDEEFNKWLDITDKRRSGTERALFEKYFRDYMPSKNNSQITFYLGALNGKIVGGSCLYKNENYVSLYFVGVDPAYRRKGVGKLLSYVPLKDARDQGYRWTVLQAQPLGAPVYPKLGFKIVGEMEVYTYTVK